MVVRSLYLLPLSWAFVGIGLVMWLWQKTTVLLLFIPPVAFILLMVALLLDARGVTVAAAMTGPVFALHLVSIFAGLGLMSVAAGAAVIFLWQQKKLKMKIRLAGLRGDLPSMAALDRINSLATLVGFPFYTLGVICGFAWARLAWGSIFSGDPKELISLIVWALYALLFHQRQALGWQGRKPGAHGAGYLRSFTFLPACGQFSAAYTPCVPIHLLIARKAVYHGSYHSSHRAESPHCSGRSPGTVCPDQLLLS